MAKKETKVENNNQITKQKALGMVAVTPRDKDAMKMFYKNYQKEHGLRVWLTKFEKDGFNILNAEKLLESINK